MGINNYLRSPSLNFYISSRPDQAELPFPKKTLQVGEDSCMVYYDIPEKKMQWVLDRCQQSPDNRLHPEDLMFDLFAGKSFKWKDCMVLWHRNANVIASPYFVESGAFAGWFCVPWRPGIQPWGIPNIVK